MEDHKMLTQRTTEIKRMLASLIAEAEG